MWCYDIELPKFNVHSIGFLVSGKIGTILSLCTLAANTIELDQ